MSIKRFSAELCAYLGELKCARYMWHEVQGVVNKSVNIIYGVQVLLKTSDMIDLKCARYMWHELLGVENKFVNIIHGVKVLLKTSNMIDLKDLHVVVFVQYKY